MFSANQNTIPAIIGTNAERTALSTVNLLQLTKFIESDTHNAYVWEGSGWVYVGTDSSAELVTGTLIDRSGTITLGGTAQSLAPANASRKYFLFQNISAGNLYINFTTTAVALQPSITVAAGGSFVMESSFVSGEAISVIGATTGQAFTAKEA